MGGLGWSVGQRSRPKKRDVSSKDELPVINSHKAHLCLL